MAQVEQLIREYRGIVDQENGLARRKEALRVELLGALTQCGRKSFACGYGTALQTTRFNLTPRRDPVLALLKPDDLLPFAKFWPKRVQEVLVPKYGREALLPLFDVQQSAVLVVKGPDDRNSVKPLG